MDTLAGYASDGSSSSTDNSEACEEGPEKQKNISNVKKEKENVVTTTLKHREAESVLKVETEPTKNVANPGARTSIDADERKETAPTQSKGGAVGVGESSSEVKSQLQKTQALERKRPFLARAQPLFPSKRSRVVERTPKPQATKDADILHQVHALPPELIKDVERDGVDLANIVEYRGDHVSDSHVMAAGKRSSDAYRRSRQCTSRAGPVSRLQRQKHQIGSVAAALAANQVAIEEKREKSTRSKAASWAKYGW